MLTSDCRLTFKWETLTVKDFYIFLAIIFFHGSCESPPQTDSWRKKWPYNFSFPSEKMTQERFEAILWSLHPRVREWEKEEHCGAQQTFQNKAPVQWDSSRLQISLPAIPTHLSRWKDGGNRGQDKHEAVYERSVGATPRIWITFTPAPPSTRICLKKHRLLCLSGKIGLVFYRLWTMTCQKGLSGEICSGLGRTNFCLWNGWTPKLYSAWGLQWTDGEEKGEEAGVWQRESVPCSDDVVDYSCHMGGADLLDALTEYHNVQHKTM